MRILIITLTFATITTFTSCDCIQNVTGTVIDAETNQPIQGALVHKRNKDYDKDETDEKGNFLVESISGGPFGCPAMTVEISMDGYIKQTVEIDNAGHETIKLKRINN